MMGKYVRNYVIDNPCTKPCGKLPESMFTGHQAVIGHQQLSDAVELYGVFLHTRDFAGGRGILVNHKIRRNELANDQEIYMLT